MNRRLAIAISALTLVAINVMVLFWPRPPTVVFVIRHAERNDSASCEPALLYNRQNRPLLVNPQGQSSRALSLAHVGGEDSISAIYASEFCRTQQTVQPLATQLGLAVTVVNQFAADGSLDVDPLIDHVWANNRGRVVLIAGHTDSVPVIIEELGGGTIAPITENEFDNLFVVIIPRWWGQTRLVRLKYGAPT